MKKLAALIVEKECKEINDDIRENDCITQNKTVRLIKKVKDCKRFYWCKCVISLYFSNIN